MTRLIKPTLVCPCCHGQFETTLVVSTTYGRKVQTDFRQRTFGPEPVRFLVHACDKCGFCGTREWFDRILAAELRRLVTEQLPVLSNEELDVAPWRKFESAARIAIWSTRPAGEIASIYISAAHVADDEHADHVAKELRIKAAEQLALALADKTIEAEAVPETTYMVGELYRRAGAIEVASDWLRRAEDLARRAEDLGWLAELAAQQRTDPREFME